MHYCTWMQVHCFNLLGGHIKLSAQCPNVYMWRIAHYHNTRVWSQTKSWPRTDSVFFFFCSSIHTSKEGGGIPPPTKALWYYSCQNTLIDKCFPNMSLRQKSPKMIDFYWAGTATVWSKFAHSLVNRLSLNSSITSFSMQKVRFTTGLGAQAESLLQTIAQK